MGKERRCLLSSANHLLSILFLFFIICTFLLFSSSPLCHAEDTMRKGGVIKDDRNNVTLVSERRIFALGFFNPPGVSGRRYFGIWYCNISPQTFVWVANRESPLLSAGKFGFNENGNLELLDEGGVRPYWSTALPPSPASNRMVKLMDSGNLVLRNDNDQSAVSLWQSFENPSDTFLPGMKMDGNIMLTSWSSKDDPLPGEFTFKQDPEHTEQFIIMKNSTPYWKSGARGEYFSSDRMLDAVGYLLSNSGKTMYGVHDYKRLVMDFAGKISYQQWLEYKKEWAPIWSEPRDECSVFNVCGNYGSCNSNYEILTCKCLPGYETRFTENWSSGDFSGGCIRTAKLCTKDDKFLRLENMKVGNQGSSRSPTKNEAECRKKCLNDCHCRGYAFDVAHESRRKKDHTSASASCWTWLDYLNDVQEERTNGGQNLSVRVSWSALEPKPRTCRPCGTSSVPYPLSTGLDCGDPMYFSFKCNNSRLTFKTLSGEYPVVGNINPSMKTFFIVIENLNECVKGHSNVQNLHFNESLPFSMTKNIFCRQRENASEISVEFINQVEIEWASPQEPACTSDANCRGWPDSTCSRTSDGTRRCRCRKGTIWDGLSLSCTLDKVPDITRSPEKGIPFLVVVPTAAGVVVLACAILSFIICRRKMTKKQGDERYGQRNRALLTLDTQRHIKTFIDSGTFEEDEDNIGVPCFSFESILAATDYFSDANKLGEGGYGPVYKGNFPEGQEIAIKRLSSVSGQGLQEFKNEVVLIAKLQHRNLVKLRGYCSSGDEKILLYEYMPNRSLDSFIFDPTTSTLLDWEMRFDIILGVARGLLYLHQDSRLRIIHRDLKTSNILLDHEMRPKISDFGLARIVGGKQTEANTNRVVGTYGYMSPEYALEGLFSVKSDVFSFGVVLLEIISGKRNTRFFQSGQPQSLLAYAWGLWAENKKLELVDQTLQESCKEEQFIKCMNVGLLCVQEDPSDRPNMSNVITMLDGEYTTLPSPKQPAFVARRGSTTASSSSTKPDARVEITTSLEEGR